MNSETFENLRTEAAIRQPVSNIHGTLGDQMSHPSINESSVTCFFQSSAGSYFRRSVCEFGANMVTANRSAVKASPVAMSPNTSGRMLAIGPVRLIKNIG